MIVLGVDIGGSGIKGALVDTKKGKLISKRHRVETPASLMPEAVLPAVAELVKGFDYKGPVGVGYPAVVVAGKPKTPFTAIQVEEWVGFPVAARLQQLTGQPVKVINDADAAGIAEMRFGAGRSQNGVVIVVTLGTGIGSALFIDGNLVPNTEFGALYLQGHDSFVENYAASRVKEDEGLKWRVYAARLDEYFHYLDRLFTPDLLIVGGGVSKKHHKYIPRLTVPYRVVPAGLRNHAGIIGAAVAAMTRPLPAAP